MYGNHSVTIGVRGLVYRDVSSNSASSIAYRTESSSDFIKSFTVDNRISFYAFKQMVINAYIEKTLPVNSDGK